MPPDRSFDKSQGGAVCLCAKLIMDTEAAGRADLFRPLYDASHDRVHRLLGRMVGPQDAEDLTQIVFAKAAKALPQFRGDAQASTWLYRIAANVAADWLRGRPAREAKLTVPLADGADGEASASVAVADVQASPEQRLVLSDEEVAQTLGISRANAKVRLHRARAQLKQAIGARCDFYRAELSCAPNSSACCLPAAAADGAKSER